MENSSRNEGCPSAIFDYIKVTDGNRFFPIPPKGQFHFLPNPAKLHRRG
jgi:hypothetical protein